MEYKLLSFGPDEQSARAGILIEDLVYDLGELLDGAKGESKYDAARLISIFQNWQAAQPAIEKAAANPKIEGAPVDKVNLCAPILYPSVLYMAGANYVDHLKEMTGKPPPPKSECKPFFFIKTTQGTIIGPGDTIELPAYSKAIDWEIEVAMVIGKTARNVSIEDAMDHIAGYTILNDLSARDLMKRDDVPFVFDWIGQKCFDTAAPMGPWIVPADQIGDPLSLDLKLWVNDILKQDSNTANMYFNYAEQISYLSEHITLNPGDVISTGTPAGVGMPNNDFLSDGDRVKIVIEGIGELSNPVIQL